MRKRSPKHGFRRYRPWKRRCYTWLFGGTVKDTQGLEFVEPENLDIVGIYPNYAKALDAWRGASHAHVDEANTKYVIGHPHLPDVFQDWGAESGFGGDLGLQ